MTRVAAAPQTLTTRAVWARLEVSAMLVEKNRRGLALLRERRDCACFATILQFCVLDLLMPRRSRREMALPGSTASLFAGIMCVSSRCRRQSVGGLLVALACCAVLGSSVLVICRKDVCRNV